MLAPSIKPSPVASGIGQMLSASVSVITNPLTFEPVQRFSIAAGRRIKDVLPADFNSVPVVARYNGLWLLRKDWDLPLAPGDHLEFHSYPQGNDDNGGSIRTVLMVIVAIVAYYYGVDVGSALGATNATSAQAIGQAFISIAGSLVVNAIIKPTVSPFGNDAPGTTPSYNVSLSGNQARLGQAIPVLYGYNQSFPDFAAQPYMEYDNNTSDQYYFALFCIGHGLYFINSVNLDDTLIDNFKDVEYKILQPGELPTLVLANVVTAPEVTGQELKSGQFVGPFVVCAPTLTVSAVGFDIVFSGLGSAQNDGSMTERSVTLDFSYREVDDLGFSIGEWTTLQVEEIKGATANAVRRSFKYPVIPSKRIEVRVVRTDVKDDNTRELNTPIWAGLRGYIDQSAPLAPTATHLEVRMRASDQLSGLSQRKISVRTTRKIPIWNGVTWSEPVENRSIAWALADKWRSTVYGDGLPDSRIDYASLLELDEIWSKRQDRFDFIFDSRMPSYEADQLIAGAGRAAVVRRQGSVRTVIRDQLQEAPLTQFPANTIRQGSFSTKYMMATPETPDGLMLEYWDNRRFDYLTIRCPCPGVTPETMVNPLWFRILGVTGRTHAEREGLFLAAASFYRRKSTTFSTELLGMMPTYGSLIRAAPLMFGWGYSGSVKGYLVDSKELSLREAVKFIPGGSHHISLQRDDGTYTDPIQVSPGSDDFSVFLDEDPDFTVITDDPTREPPKFVFGLANATGQDIVVRSMSPKSKDNGTVVVELAGVVENEAVHHVDEHLLPSDDDEQDPVIDGNVPTDPNGNVLLIVNLEDTMFLKEINGTDYIVGPWEVEGAIHWAGDSTYQDPPQPSPDYYTPIRLEMRNDGTMWYKMSDDWAWTKVNQQWSKFGAVEPILISEYEVFAHVLISWAAAGQDSATDKYLSDDSSPVEEWLDMSTTRMWAMDPNKGSPLYGYLETGYMLTLEISVRKKETTTLVDIAKYLLKANRIDAIENAGDP